VAQREDGSERSSGFFGRLCPYACIAILLLANGFLLDNKLILDGETHLLCWWHLYALVTLGTGPSAGSLYVYIFILGRLLKVSSEYFGLVCEQDAHNERDYRTISCMCVFQNFGVQLVQRCLNHPTDDS